MLFERNTGLMYQPERFLFLQPGTKYEVLSAAIALAAFGKTYDFIRHNIAPRIPLDTELQKVFMLQVKTLSTSKLLRQVVRCWSRQLPVGDDLLVVTPRAPTVFTWLRVECRHEQISSWRSNLHH